jgi:hypothetical protein
MRRWLLATLAALGLAVLAAAALVFVVDTRIGRTPAELIGYAERRLQGHNSLERLAAPALHGLRAWFGVRAPGEARPAFVVPRLPPNPLSMPDGSAVVPAPGVIRVGPRQAVTSVALAAGMAKDGDTIEIEPGDYLADVASWDRAEITIRGLGQQVRMIAGGRDAEGKAIWVVRRGRVTIENIAFIDARVADGNGAGIRLESGHLTVRNCLFYGNQNGILTTGDGSTRLDIENSEFAYNGAGDGITHNLYVGAIGMLKVTGSYFHHANVGHLLKSRAQQSRIEYNRLTDEAGGRASYELEFPNGGVAQVVGNIVQQGAETSNSVMISFGAEGYTWQQNRLLLSHNTVVNDHPQGGSFLRVAAGADAVVTRNNLFVGRGLVAVAGAADAAGNHDVDWSAFVQPAREDYRLSSKGRQAITAAVPATQDLTPRYEYAHPRALKTLAGPPAYPGALQTPGP